MDEEIIAKYREAGRIARESLKLGEELIKPGKCMRDALLKIEEFILREGGFPAFPPQISLNEVAAHFYPDESVLFKEGDLAKLDVGVSVDGFIADNAVTYDLGNNKELVSASREALDEALKLVRPGVKIRDIGKKIQEVITSKGFVPIINLSGHGLGRFKVHMAPTIANVDIDSEHVLEEGMVVAVEPFATTGAGMVYESSHPTIFTLLQEKPLRRPESRKVLEEIKSYNGLPFSSPALFRKFGKASTLFAIREMKQQGMLREHPPLIEKDKGLVSQAEHSVLVLENPIIYTREEE